MSATSNLLAPYDTYVRDAVSLSGMDSNDILATLAEGLGEVDVCAVHACAPMNVDSDGVHSSVHILVLCTTGLVVYEAAVDEWVSGERTVPVLVTETRHVPRSRILEVRVQAYRKDPGTDAQRYAINVEFVTDDCLELLFNAETINDSEESVTIISGHANKPSVSIGDDEAVASADTVSSLRAFARAAQEWILQP